MNQKRKPFVTKKVVKKTIDKKAILIAEKKALLHNITRISDPRKHKDFKLLNYASLKKLGFNLQVLHQGYHLRIGDLYRIGVPVKELVNQFGLKSVLGYTQFASPFREVIPMKELRKIGVSAKELMNEKVPFGALFHYGNYTRKELVQAGVPIERLNVLGKKGNPISKIPKRRQLK